MAKDGRYISHGAQREADHLLCLGITLALVEQSCVQIDYFSHDKFVPLLDMSSVTNGFSISKDNQASPSTFSRTGWMLHSIIP